MAYEIEDIEGIGPSYAQKLSIAKIRTTNDLLKICADAQGRASTSERTGVSETQLLKWTNLADLMRVRGISSEYSELLEAAGVDTIKELRNRNPHNLAARIQEINRVKKLSRMTPSAKTVEKWVAEAAKLSPVITY